MNRLRVWLDAIRKDRLVRETMPLAGGTIAGQAIVMLAMPVITRLYLPTEMGEFGLILSFIGFLSVAMGLRYEMAIPSAADQTDADRLLQLATILTIPCAALAGAILFLMIKLEIGSYGALPMWSVAAGSVALIVTGVFTALRYWIVRQQSFSGIGSALLAQGTGRSVVSVLWGMAGGGWIGLVAGEIVGRLAAIAQLLRVAGATRPPLRGLFDWPQQARTARKFWRLPAIVLPSALLSSLAPMLPIPVLSVLFGSAAAGHFLIAQRLCAVPGGMVSASVNDVLHSRIALVNQQSPDVLRDTFRQVFRRLGIIALVLYVPMIVLAPLLSGRILGSEWSESGVLVAILVPKFLVELLTAPMARVFVIIDRNGLKLMLDALNLSPIAMLYWCHAHDFSLRGTLVVFSAVSAACGLLEVLVVWGLSARTVAESRATGNGF